MSTSMCGANITFHPHEFLGPFYLHCNLSTMGQKLVFFFSPSLPSNLQVLLGFSILVGSSTWVDLL
ncbi:hypothetical protein ACMD2_20504, partial [Ananas comosus]